MTLEYIQQNAPIQLQPYVIKNKKAGLIIVDAVNGFCTVGCGPLAPPAPDVTIATMVNNINTTAQHFDNGGLPIFVTLDSHDADKPEPPYPPHCIAGTGDDELVPALTWLNKSPNATLMRKDCINGFIGAITQHHTAQGTTQTNLFLDWVNTNQLQTVVMVGICTDICVMDLTLTILSARNHQLCPTLCDVVVHAPDCATYDLSPAVAKANNLPATASHPRDLTHHMGLYFMASRGAILSDTLIF